MSTTRKLKSDRSITGPVQPVIALALFGIAYALGGLILALLVLGSIYILYFILTMYMALRVRNVYLLIIGVFQILAAAFFLINPEGPFYFDHTFFNGVTVVWACSMIMSLYILVSNKIKWRGREIFELAARNIDANPGSFTERPKPSGRIEIRRDELFEFARYYQRRMLGICKRENSSLIFIPVRMDRFVDAIYNPYFRYRENTHVAIDLNGNVSTFISRKDYNDYREDLAFDELNESMGRLHLEFFELYCKGSEVRIMDKIRGMNPSLFS